MGLPPPLALFTNTQMPNLIKTILGLTRLRNRSQPVNPLHEVVQENDVRQAETQKPELRRKGAHVRKIVKLFEDK